MKSRISIDLDTDNQPIIVIDYIQSEDVRDKMVKRFLEGFEYSSTNAHFEYLPAEINNSRAMLRPKANPKPDWVKQA